MTRPLLAALLLLALSPAPAHAICSGYTVDGYTVLGEDKDNPGKLAMCNWNYSTGIVRYALLGGCSTSTPAGEVVKISDSGVYHGASIVGPVVEAGGIVCRPSAGGARIIYPWPASFHFGIVFTGYFAKPHVYGTPNTDYIYSASYVDTVDWSDGEDAILCGYGGDDYLFGDYSTSTADDECMNGGNGDDYCDGSSTDTWSEDTAYSCEGYSSVASVDVDDCGCGAGPPPIWSTICSSLPGGC